MVASINYDIGNMYGKTKDMVGLGTELYEGLGKIFKVIILPIIILIIIRIRIRRRIIIIEYRRAVDNNNHKYIERSTERRAICI